VLVVLSDGQVRSNPALNPECDQAGSFEDCGAKLLAIEMKHPMYKSHITLRWAFGTPAKPTLHPDSVAFRTAQIDAVTSGSEVYKYGMRRNDACFADASSQLVDWLLNADEIKQCPTTPTTTATSTATTNCNALLADIMFVFDLSSSLEKTSCSSESVAKYCPGYADGFGYDDDGFAGIAVSTCLMYDFAAGVIEDLGGAVNHDGVRIGAVTFSDRADKLLDGKFVTDPDEALKGLSGLLDIPVRQPTRAATAFELLNDEYFAPRSNVASGYRYGEVPLIIVMITDARSLNTNGNLESLVATSPLAEATRLVYSFVDAEDPFPGQHSLLSSIANGSSNASPPQLKCTDAGKDLVHLNKMARDNVVERVKLQDCLTTATSTPTASETTTATTTASSTATTPIEPTSQTITVTTTATSTMTTSDCQPVADVVFVVDESSSLSNDESNVANAFGCLRSVALGIVKGLGRRVQRDGFRVATVTYASSANVLFDFRDYADDRDKMKAELNAMEIPNYNTTETSGSLHLALQKVRTEVMSPSRGYVDQSRPVVVIVLSDGQVGADPSNYAVECSQVTTVEECGAVLLQLELEHSAYASMVQVRWAFGVPTISSLHQSTKNFRAAQLEVAVKGTAELGGKLSLFDACHAQAVPTFVDWMLNSPLVSECPESTTASSTMTTSATSTATTTTCNSIAADLVFVFDTSASTDLIGDRSCGMPSFCPWTDSDTDEHHSTCMAYNFAVDVVLGLGSLVNFDQIRIAGVAFSDKATLLLDGKFKSDPNEVIKGLTQLGSIESRQPTRTASAFQKLQEKMFPVTNPSNENGYRYSKVPLYVVTITDARSLNQEELATQLRKPPFADSTRMAFSLQGAKNPFPGQYELLDTVAANSTIQRIGCSVGGSEYGAKNDLHVQSILEQFVSVDCLTTGTSTVTSSPTTSASSTATNSMSSTATTTGSTTASTTQSQTATSTQTASPTTTVTTTATSTVTTHDCMPLADIVFLFDTSTSIGNKESNDLRAPDCFRTFANESISKLGRRVQRGRFQVAAVEFDDTARVGFNFHTHADNRSALIGSLQNIPYPDWQSTESQTNLHLALAKVRTDLMTRSAGHTEQSTPFVVVVLSDGQVRSNPALNPECDQAGSFEECGAHLLQKELSNPLYNSAISLRWALGTPETPSLHSDYASFRAAQLEKVKAKSNVYADGSITSTDACDPNASSEFAEWMLYNPAVRQCPTTATSTMTSTVISTATTTPGTVPTVTQTTSFTTTATSTFTSTPCSRFLMDIVFVFDLSSSLEYDDSCNVKRHCPNTFHDGPDSTCVAYDFAASILNDIGQSVNYDEVRVAAVTFSDEARALLNGKFVSDPAEALAGLRNLTTIPIRQPTRAATAFKLLDAEYFAAGIESGYRHGAVPLMVIMVTDGRSLDTDNQLGTLMATEPLASATRLVYSFKGADKAFDGQHKVLSSLNGIQYNTDMLRLQCNATGALNAYMNEDARDSIMSHIPRLDCLTTATTTATSSASSTVTATATTTLSSTATTSASATISTTGTTTASTTVTTTATTTASVTVTTSATTSQSTTATASVTSTASSSGTTSPTTTQSSTATSTERSTPSSTGSTTATSTVTTTASTTRSSTATTSISSSPSTTVTSSLTSTATTSVTSTATATRSSSATSTATSTASTSATSTPSTSATSTPSTSATSTLTSTGTVTPEIILAFQDDDALAASTNVQASNVGFCEEGDKNCGIVMSGVGLTFLLIIIAIIIFCCAKNKDGKVGPDTNDQNLQTPSGWVPHNLPIPAWPAMVNRSPPPRFDSMPQLLPMQKSSMYRTPWADDSFAASQGQSPAAIPPQKTLRRSFGNQVSPSHPLNAKPSPSLSRHNQISPQRMERSLPPLRSDASVLPHLLFGIGDA